MADAVTTAGYARAVPILAQLLRQRIRLVVLCGAGLFAVFVLFGLFVMPQRFTCDVSISMVQPTNTPSTLAALTGMQTGNQKYTGILRSRRFAEAAERITNLHAVYEISRDKTVERIMRGLKVDDNATDGLIYVTLSLPAPPRLRPDPTDLRGRVREATAQVANAYTLILRNYLQFSDTDKDLALLRTGRSQLHQAQRAYSTSTAKLQAFVQRYAAQRAPGRAAVSRVIDRGALPPSPDPQVASSALQALLTTRGQLASQLQSAGVDEALVKRMVRGDPRALANIPTEDPVLYAARARVSGAQSSLNELLINYADTAPQVVQARRRLDLAETDLKKQIQGILAGHTTDEVKREALVAQLSSLNAETAGLEQSLGISRSLQAELKQMENEVEISMHFLEAVESSYAQLSLQTVSAQNRMTVIDDARPPAFSQPGLLMTGAGALGASVAVMLSWLAGEYLIRSRRVLAQPQS